MIITIIELFLLIVLFIILNSVLRFVYFIRIRTFKFYRRWSDYHEVKGELQELRGRLDELDGA